MKKQVARVAPKRAWIRPELTKLNASHAELGLDDYLTMATGS